MRRYLVYSLSVFAIAGCSDATAPTTGDVVLVPTKSLYVSGETVSAQLFNRDQAQIEYGDNALRLQCLRGGRWELVGPDELPGLGWAKAVEAGATLLLQTRLDPSLEPGRYRLRFEFNWPNRYVYSPDFDLQSAD